MHHNVVLSRLKIACYSSSLTIDSWYQHTLGTLFFSL
uniref:Uncharacterized protein n=1 Tax=Arundo donax TaxID=35708 RepID=A0A0A9FSQ4_ARUDO